MFRNMSIKASLMLIIGCMFFIIIATITLSLYGIGSVKSDFDSSVYITQKEQQPLAITYASFKGVRLAAQAYSDIKLTGADPAPIIKSLEKQLKAGEENFESSNRVPSLTPEGKKLREEIEDAYKNYHDLLVMVHKTILSGDYTFYDKSRVHLGELDGRLNTAINRFEAFTTRLNEQKINSASTTHNLMLNIGAATGVFSAMLAFLSFVIVRTKILSPLNEMNLRFMEIAKGNLTQEIVIGSENEIGKLFMSLSEMQNALRIIVSDVQDSSVALIGKSQEISLGNDNLNERTEQQAAAVVQTAASLEELTSTVRMNADSAEEANRIAGEASVAAEKGGEIMKQVSTTMDEIAAKAKKVSSITSVINSIAFQTNILALNAAVESARAGEHGRGFAVVASEVRGLAKKSGEAAKEIELLIGESVLSVDKGHVLVGNATESIEKLVKNVSSTSEIMANISVATQEQSLGISQVSIAVNQIDAITQQNAELVSQASGDILTLSKQADLLEGTVSRFRLN